MSQPALVATGGMVYLSTLDDAVRVVHAATGAVAWTRQMRDTSAPWIYNEKVYVSQRDEDGRASR